MRRWRKPLVLLTLLLASTGLLAGCGAPPDVESTVGDFQVTDGVLTEFTGKSTVITIPDEVVEIGPKAFYNATKIKTVTMPDSVTTIGESAFHGCDALTEVTLGEGVTTIGRHAFEFCKKLERISLPDSLEIIGLGAFSACHKLNHVAIPDTGVHIEGRAFSYNLALEDITLPRSAWVCANAFEKCDKLKGVPTPEVVYLPIPGRKLVLDLCNIQPNAEGKTTITLDCSLQMQVDMVTGKAFCPIQASIRAGGEEYPAITAEVAREWVIFTFDTDVEPETVVLSAEADGQTHTLELDGQTWMQVGAAE